MTRIVCASSLLLLVLAAACNRSEAPAAPAGGEPGAAPEAATVAAANAASATATIPCELVALETLIENVRLQSADGGCKLYLPSPPTVGEYSVRVSAAGGSDVAALEVRHDDTTLYATSGTVSVTSVDGGRVRGRIDATDDAPPALGSVAVDFDVPLATP